jgi:cytochrome c peroxidase
MRTARWTTIALALACAAGAAAGPAARESVQSGAYTLVLPVGLQASAAYVPDANPLSNEKIELGRILYFDKRLSKDDTVSCATCHDPAHGFAEPRKTSQGVGGKTGARNAPTVLNRLFSADQFWDGRAKDLEAQAIGPMVNPVEMAMPSHAVLVAKIAGIAGYRPLFAKAFGTPDVTIDRVAQAIASFERVVVAGNSPVDRWEAGDKTALSDAAARGRALFAGKANCITCHAGFNFTDESYHNLGVGMDAAKPDVGRFEVTKAESDTGAFKTPTLRSIALTAPYMHDGSEATLRDVIDFYDRGGNKNPYLAKEVRPLGLAPSEKDDLVAFLEALTCEAPAVTPPAALPQ